MEAPKCRHCGKRHWDRVCPELARRAKGGDAKSTAITPTANTIERTAELQASEPAPVAKAAGAKYDRNAAHKAYMRAYMRRHRAKLKAQKDAKP